ncbi:ATP-dependent DNA helicase RecG [Myceligenerans xiligouense]|uniref:ATP-dependent DNA helicase RecG n=1 Tax=Myceligenerans xiligouense TaxID=253184 RepID=A0A3N4YIF7_9MICO|nr:ATP-dependent DNA helicase RecG [Myceligenerans xiligouense]
MAAVSTDLAETLGTQETASLEFKDYANIRNRMNDLGKYVCAMANDLVGAGGGDILIGVKDDGTPADSVDTSDQTLLALTDLRDNGKILDRPSLTVEVATYREREVVRIRVQASATPPVRYDGRCWVRPGPSVREATRDDERVLSERRRSADGPFDTRAALGTTLDELDLEMFRSTYLPAMVAPEVIAENGRPVGLQLASLHLAQRSGDPVPTMLGLLVIGFDPSSRIPGAYVQFVRYQGTDLTAPIADERELRGNIVDVADQLSPLVRGHLRSRLVSDGGFREEQAPDYPIEALREICMNSLMHRNYETSNAPVRIVWFDDRVEVSNPGGPFGQVRSDNFDRVTDYRNPSLAAAMKALGYVNRFGRGIGRVRESLRRNGNPEPEFVVDDASWTVTVRRQV